MYFNKNLKQKIKGCLSWRMCLFCCIDKKNQVAAKTSNSGQNAKLPDTISIYDLLHGVKGSDGTIYFNKKNKN